MSDNIICNTVKSGLWNRHVKKGTSDGSLSWKSQLARHDKRIVSRLPMIRLFKHWSCLPGRVIADVGVEAKNWTRCVFTNLLNFVKTL